MRNIVCILFCVVAMVAAYATDDEEAMKIGLATLFNISLTETESCLQQTGVKQDDLVLFERVVTERWSGPIDKRSLRRAGCALACLANAEGTMTGSRIEMSEAHHVIQKMAISQADKATIHDAMNFCYEQVKQITDACDVTFEYVKCLAAQIRELHL